MNAETKIKAKDLFFSEFHTKGTEVFYIPSLQRPYTWESKKQVEKLYDDINENAKQYYIGSIVTVSGGNTASKDQIIDGQQRVTTLYLMLIACRDYALAIGGEEAGSLASDIDDYLIKYKKQNGELKEIVRLSFTNESSNLAYESVVFNKNKSKLTSGLQKRFSDNYSYLYKRISDDCGKGKIRIDRLRDFFHKIESLQLIFIDCLDKSAAFKLFESINATGLDLSTNDLIKNSIFEKLHKDEKALEEAELGWSLMFEEFEENSSLLKTYIRHHWLSTVGYTSHAKLFDEFSEKYKTKEQISEYSKDLYASAQIYKSLRSGNVETLTRLPNARNDLLDIKESLIFLSSLGVDQVYSVLLKLYNAEKNDSFKKDLVKLVSFQFLFKFVPGSPSVPEKIFADFCKGDITKQKMFTKLNKLCAGKQTDFVESFSDKMKYSGSNTAGVQHVLEKHMYYYGPESAKCPEPTIEHIIPQDKKDVIYKKIEKVKNQSKLIHSIGNLTILSRSENSDRKKFNQEFAKKYPLYSKSVFKVNKALKRYKFDIDPEKAIKLRGQRLSKEIYPIYLLSLVTGKWPKHDAKKTTGK